MKFARPTIYLHIGRHKTGTTSIQKILSENYERLKSSGILYPISGRLGYLDINHHGLFKNTKRRVNFSSQLNHSSISKLVDEINREGLKHVVLSTEIFSRTDIDESVLREFKSLLGFDFKIIVYFRKQSSFLLSSYAERLKQGVVKRNNDILDLDLQLDYNEFLKKFTAVFGENNIRVSIFEVALQKGIFQDFCNNADLNTKIKFSVPSKKLNEKYCWGYLYFISRFKTGSLMFKLLSFSRLQRVFNIVFQKFSPGMPPLTSDQIRNLDRKYVVKNKALSDEFLEGKKIDIWES